MDAQNRHITSIRSSTTCHQLFVLKLTSGQSNLTKGRITLVHESFNLLQLFNISFKSFQHKTTRASLLPARVIMAAKGKAIIVYRCIFYFVSMNERPAIWDLNQTWPVGRKWCRFRPTIAPKIFGLFPKLGAQKSSHFERFSRLSHSTPQSLYLERNVASTNKKASVNLQCIC